MVSTASPSSGRFALEEATPADSAELLDLLEASPMPGPISLVYTRRPDPWRSFQREGERVRVLVARAGAGGGVAAMAAFAIRTLHVDGVPAPVAYLFGLRARGDALRRWPGLRRGYARIGEELRDRGVRHAITTIVASNRRVAAMLGRPRRSIPAYRSLGRYDVFALIPGRRRRPPASLRAAGPGDAERLASFLNEQGRRQQFFPCVRAGDLHAGRGLPPLGAFRWIEGRSGEVLAAAALWDQADYRQYRVHGYGPAVAWARRLARLAPFLPLPRLPAPGTELRHATLACWASRDDDPGPLADLLDAMIAPGPAFVLAGAHAGHPLHGVFRRRRHVAYRSEVFRVDWGPAPAALDERPLYLECGTL